MRGDGDRRSPWICSLYLLFEKMKARLSQFQRPTLVKVMNHDFEIKWVDGDVESGAQKYGWCNCNDQVIAVSSRLRSTQIADTFLHEVIHALNWMMEIKDGAKEEEICTRLSSALCCFWRDNPEALTWWSRMIQGSSK